MSRRSQRPAGDAKRGGRPADTERTPAAGAPGHEPPKLSFAAQVGILVAVFAVVSLIAELAGAANLGVAFGIGQIFFAIALVIVIVKN